jgi:hypothetical protein
MARTRVLRFDRNVAKRLNFREKSYDDDWKDPLGIAYSNRQRDIDVVLCRTA